jgi:hypothetical protein
MSPHTALVISVIATSMSAIMALAAAGLWFWSATVTIPNPGQFPIVVVRPRGSPIGQPADGTIVGHGYSEELQGWASALSAKFSVQSDRSAWAAVATAVAGVLAAVGVSSEILATYLKVASPS